MSMSSFRLRPWVFLAGIALFAIGGLAAADPPSRAARLGYMSGAVSFSPAGEDAWVQAALNRPLTTGDRLWADADSRAEVQVGGAALRMGASTSLTLLNLDDSIAQVQLTQGTLKVRVRRLAPNQAFEVDTPNLAFTLRRPGEYRIEVDPAGDATAVMVQSGQGEVYGDGASYVVDSRQGYRFAGTGLSDYQLIDPRRDDDFDRWASERDRRSDNSASARYVSSDVVGYEDLDGNGAWRNDPGYGNVWVPNNMAADWTPYQEGHWAWVDPWGWTWVDDASWGFAVSHFGRWANMRGTWGWVPGPRASRAVYAPALVAFIGSGILASISLGGGGAVGWFPLAPRDVYRPSYSASRAYFNNVNRSNTVINSTTITNVYNTTNVTKIVYANRQVPGAVVAVPTTTFVHAQPVRKAAVRVTKEQLAGAAVSAVAAVAPVPQSVHGTAAAGAKPPARDHGIVARSAPPPPPVGLAAQQKQLAARPGRPIEEAARKQLKPVAPVPAPKVSVVATGQAKPPVAAPPAARARDGGGRPDQGRAAAATSRREPAAPQQSPVSPEAARSPTIPPAAGRPSAAETQAPQPASRPGRRDESARPAPPARGDRSPPVSPPVGSPPAVAMPTAPAAAIPPAAVASPAVATSPAPTAPSANVQPPPQAARPARRDEAARPAATPRSERPPAVSPPAVSPPLVSSPAAPATVPPAAVAQPPQQAARPAQREEAARPAMPPRAERPPAAAPPAAVGTPPQQRARPEPPVQETPRAAPPVVLLPQVRPPPIVAPPPIAPTPAPAPAPQRARPEPRVQPVVPTPAPQAAPAPVRPPAPAAPAAAPPPVSKPAAQPAPKPAPDAGKAAERKKPGEENPK